MELKQYQYTVTKRAKPLDTVKDNLDHALYGMVTETGEIASVIKKTVIYSKPLDEANLREELGDLMFYVCLACNTMGWQLSDILDENDAKLEKRYPIGKYTDEHASLRLDKQD